MGERVAFVAATSVPGYRVPGHFGAGPVAHHVGFSRAVDAERPVLNRPVALAGAGR